MTLRKTALVHRPARLLHILAAFALLSIAPAAVAAPEDGAAAEPPPIAGKPVVLKVGQFSLVSSPQIQHLEDSLARAASEGASAIILQIDCTGGFASEARSFAERLARLDIPTIAWIPERAAGAGAIVALAADKLYLAEESMFGGEVEAVEWRGPKEALPGRLTDLRYSDIISDLEKSLAERDLPDGLISGVCDPSKEVRIGDEKLSDSGDVLEFDAENGQELGIVTGVAADVEKLLAAAGIDGEPVRLAAPEISLLRAKDEPDGAEDSTGEAEAASVAEDADGAAEEEDLSFGETRQASYAGKIVVLPVEMESLIRKTKFEFMERIIKKANEDGASAIIFDLHTPGGIVWYTEDAMLTYLQGLDVPTYAFVNTKAMSAGALVSISCDHIYMHPPSMIGAAAPVMGTGQDIPETMLAKVLSAILAAVEDVAKIKGYDPDLAKAFVDVDAEFRVDIPVVDEEGHLSSKVVIDIGEGELLTLGSADATQIVDGRPLLAEGTAKSVEDLIAKAGLQGEVINAKPLGFEAVADWIVKLAPWLLLFGMAGAYIEFKAPGFGVPGFISLICFGLFFFGHQAAGYLAGYEAIGLFIVGIVLVILELFVFPGIFILGVTGVLLIFGTLIYAMIDPLNLSWDGKLNFDSVGGALYQPAINMVLAVIGAGLLILLALRYLPSTPIMRWMILSSDVGKGTGLKLAGEAGALDAEGGGEGSVESESLVGRTGVTETPLRPSGAARFGDLRLDVVSMGTFIDSGMSVRIVEHEGSRIAVEEV